MTISFSHITLNVSDLDRSIAFYEAFTPLRRTATTPAPEQAFASLGVPRGRFDGVVLRDPASSQMPALHLIQWIEPVSYGRAYASFLNNGLFRICFQHPNAAELYERAIAQGGSPFTPPLMPDGQNIVGRPVFCLPDPDGVVMQFVTMSGRYRLYHTAYNCRDLDAGIALGDALGLISFMRAETTIPVRNAFGPPGAPTTFRSALMGIPDDVPVDDRPSYSLDLVQWTEPQPQGDAYPDQLHNGMVRLGLAIDDLPAMRARLAKAGYACSAIEPRDFGAEVGIRQAFVIDGPDGVLIELLDRKL